MLESQAKLTKIVDFLLVTYFRAWVIFFVTVSSYITDARLAGINRICLKYAVYNWREATYCGNFLHSMTLEILTTRTMQNLKYEKLDLRVNSVV